MKYLRILLTVVFFVLVNMNITEAGNISNTVGVDKFVENFNYYSKLDNGIYRITSYKFTKKMKDGNDSYHCTVEDGISPYGSMTIVALASPSGYLNSALIVVDRTTKFEYRASVMIAAAIVRATMDMAVDDTTTIVRAIDQFCNTHSPLQKRWTSSNGQKYYVSCKINSDIDAFVIDIACD